MKIQSFIPIFLGAFIMLFIFSCENENMKEENITAKTDQTIAQFLAERDDLSEYDQTAESVSGSVAGLYENNEGPHTIFVPTNAAFEDFFSNFVDYNSVFSGEDISNARADLLREILQFHIVEDEILSGDIGEGTPIESILGQSFSGFNTSGGFFLDPETDFIFKENATPFVIERDIQLADGVVHIIDGLLLPDDILVTIARRILEREDTTIFEEALRKTDLLPTFETSTQQDAFVPTDAAWETCFQLLGNDFNSIDDFDTEEELNLLREIVLMHLQSISMDSGSFGFSPSISFESGFRLVLRDRLTGFGVKDATGLISQIEIKDIEAENRSSVHLIDRVLLPKSVTDFIVEHHHEALLTFLMNLDDIQSLFDLPNNPNAAAVIPSFITNGSPFTLLLPTRSSFMAWAEDLDGFDSIDDFNSQEGREILANVLSYHFILGETLNAGDVTILGQDYTTLQGETLSFGPVGGFLSVLDSNGTIAARIINEDIPVAAGVLHIIDAVLLPQELAFYLP